MADTPNENRRPQAPSLSGPHLEFDISKAPDNDLRPWAPPRGGVAVERRDSWEVAMHGARAGLFAGAALGGLEIAASTMLSHSPRLPFDFAAVIVVGPEALLPAFPLAASLALGTVLHVLLSTRARVLSDGSSDGRPLSFS